ncbi:chromate transporter [Aromatoleum evansii]|uniref:Chromate transporter n=1 Tax=Aromatoleum evansii TaxID=59406 RepID=A0ABZ1AV87_AROEV|nr:chromate transporter [Aromatoleum evansii]
MALLADLFLQFSILTVVAFGGITAMLPELHRLVVEQRQWMDETTFAHLFAIAQAAPGPNLLVVSLIGWKVAGIPGAIAATLAIALPMSLVIFFLYRHWERFRDAPWREAIQTGVAPLAVGLVCASGWLIGASAGLDLRGILLTLACTGLMLVRGWHPLWYIGAGAAAGAFGLV